MTGTQLAGAPRAGPVTAMRTPAVNPARGRAPAARVYAEVAVLAAVALLVRLIQLDHAPYVDELYHALAARSLLADGSLHIGGEVPYTRARLYTYLVAGTHVVFGDNLVAGRVPAVLAGVGLVAAVFLWLRRTAGRAAGWIAGILLCFAPASIYLSQQVRFYTLHALLFWLGAVAVYRAASPGSRRRRLTAGVFAVLAFYAAYQLQEVTVIGVAAVSVWLAADRAPALARWTAAGGLRRLGFVAAVLVAGAAALAVVVAGDTAAWLLSRFSDVDMWAEGNRGNVRFYHTLYLTHYPTLWTIFPLALLVAASRHRRQALFCATVFAIAFGVHSLAAWKHERYLYYALPFFFAIWGLAAAVTLPWLRERFNEVLAASGPQVPRRAATALFVVVLAAAGIFAAAGNRATSYTFSMLTVSDGDWQLGRAYRGEADWAAALPVLQAEAAGAEVILASSMLKAIYYLGRVELGVSTGEAARGRSDAEFSEAPREGVPVISRPESLALVQSCYGSGLVIADVRSWRRPWSVTQDAADYIEAAMQPVPLSGRWGIRAFRWRGSPADTPGCAELRELVGGAGG
jgi:4-amino-4-deoxy-L-arabinose transferase-like glycosyltransferase